MALCGQQPEFELGSPQGKLPSGDTPEPSTTAGRLRGEPEVLSSQRVESKPLLSR